jgi:membrane glycosyltransferase
MLQLHAKIQRDYGGLPMPDQRLDADFMDSAAPDLPVAVVPDSKRMFLFGLPLVFAAVIGSILVYGFRSHGTLSLMHLFLVASMVFLAAWEAIPTSTALLGFFARRSPATAKPRAPLSVAMLVTLRDDAIEDVMRSRIDLLNLLQKQNNHSFVLHILSDSQLGESQQSELRFVQSAAHPLIFYTHRKHNTDFKSGNIRNWIEKNGAFYDAVITLDADSELTLDAVLLLTNTLSADPACALIQSIPRVKRGSTIWQYMQSMASQLYGGMLGRGLAQWMGHEANYYGHNAIIRTRAFAACAGLPHLNGRGLWNGVILSHDFVEAALLRRAGWHVRILPLDWGSFEQAPANVIAHLKRDARWCRGNLQHSRVIGATRLALLSRFHMLAGILTYLSSVIWLAVFTLWALLEATHVGRGGPFAFAALLLIVGNLMLPRVLAVFEARQKAGAIAEVALETLFSTMFAPSFMVQRVMFVITTLANRPARWLPHDCKDKSFFDFLSFHIVEWILGLGLLALIEQRDLSPWFLPMAICLVATPFLSSLSAQPLNRKNVEVVI